MTRGAPGMYAPPALTPDAPTETPVDEPLPPSLDGTVFPAGTSLFLLAPGFFATRVFVGLSGDVTWLARAGTFASVAGATLALAASLRFVWEASALRGRWGAFALRVLALSPVCALALVGMRSTAVSHTLQWAALVGLGGTVLVAALRGVILSLGRRQWLAALTLFLFAMGQTIELFCPVASVASAPGTSLPRVARALGRVSEGFAFAGVALAVVWSLRSAVRHAGVGRAAAFLFMPLTFTAVLMTLPLRLPNTTETVARAAFGARFDLASVSGAAHPTRLALSVYTLLFTGLVAAAAMSLSTQTLDRGAGVRRAFGWTAVLLAGFGALSIAGPVDPLRAVCLVLGALLLEQAAEHEDPAPTR